MEQNDLLIVIAIALVISVVVSVLALAISLDNINNISKQTEYNAGRINYLEDSLQQLDENIIFQLEERNWIYILDENTGKKIIDPQTGFPMRLNKSGTIYGLIQANNAHEQALQEIVAWINSVS